MRKHGIRRQGDLLKLLEPEAGDHTGVLKSTVPLLATLLMEALEAEPPVIDEDLGRSGMAGPAGF